MALWWYQWTSISIPLPTRGISLAAVKDHSFTHPNSVRITIWIAYVTPGLATAVANSIEDLVMVVASSSQSRPSCRSDVQELLLAQPSVEQGATNTTKAVKLWFGGRQEATTVAAKLQSCWASYKSSYWGLKRLGKLLVKWRGWRGLVRCCQGREKLLGGKQAPTTVVAKRESCQGRTESRLAAG